MLALAATLVLSAVLGGCSSDIFTVNGKSISRARFRAEVNRRLMVVKKTNPKELEGSRGRKLKAGTEREVATEMIRQVLMEEQAVKLGVGLPPDAVKQRIEIERRKAGADKFAAGLRNQGITEAAYEEKIRGQLLVDAIGSKVCSNVSVTKDEAESFYLTNKDLFARSLLIHAAHILVDTQGEAESVAEELRAGKDFGQVAMEVSKDSATRSSGGDLGWIEQGTMDPAFETAAFGLKSGQVSAPVSASDGFHIIKVLERREASTPPFSEVWQQAMNKLETRKKDEMFGDWLRTIYANAVINTGGLGKWDARLGIVTD
ncbi:MAG: peptidylprolyl isomerase [Candidatus Geothermincolia bacterium]